MKHEIRNMNAVLYSFWILWIDTTSQIDYEVESGSSVYFLSKARHRNITPDLHQELLQYQTIERRLNIAAAFVASRSSKHVFQAAVCVQFRAMICFVTILDKTRKSKEIDKSKEENS